MSQSQGPSVSSVKKRKKATPKVTTVEDNQPKTTKTQRKWTEEDIKAVFAYLRDTIDCGFVIEVS